MQTARKLVGRKKQKMNCKKAYKGRAGRWGPKQAR
jgi:hypothetical protein